MVHQYKYTLTELENMIPWERDTYIGMVNNWVKEETERVKQAKAEQESRLSMLARKRNQTKRKR